MKKEQEKKEHTGQKQGLTHVLINSHSVSRKPRVPMELTSFSGCMLEALQFNFGKSRAQALSSERPSKFRAPLFAWFFG